MPILFASTVVRPCRYLAPATHLCIQTRRAMRSSAGRGRPAVHDSQPIIYGEHNVTQARQILIHRIRIVVVVHVMEAEHHLSRGATVGED